MYILRHQSLLFGAHFFFIFWWSSPSPFTLPGRLHLEGPDASGVVRAHREAERWGGSRPVGQPLVGAAVRHQRWWRAVQYPGPPAPAEEPHGSSRWPPLRISHFLIQTSPYTFVLVHFDIQMQAHQRRLWLTSTRVRSVISLDFLFAPRMPERKPKVCKAVSQPFEWLKQQVLCI